MKNLNEFIDKNLELLPTDGIVNPRLAQERAATILRVVADLARAREEIVNSKIKATSILSVVSENLMSGIEAKTITEKKSRAESLPQYIGAREELEVADSKASYVKTMIDVFNNAYYLYLGMAKGEM